MTSVGSHIKMLLIVVLTSNVTKNHIQYYLHFYVNVFLALMAYDAEYPGLQLGQTAMGSFV